MEITRKGLSFDMLISSAIHENAHTTGYLGVHVSIAGCIHIAVAPPSPIVSLNGPPSFLASMTNGQPTLSYLTLLLD